MAEQGIKWLASYPKSGNTWARMFLLNWFRDGDAPLSPNELDRSQFIPADYTDWLYKGAMGFPADYPIPLTVTQAAHCASHVQSYFLRLALRQDQPTIMKTHSRNLGTDKLHPNINWDVTEAAVYIVRDPIDIAASSAAHMGKTLDVSIDDMSNVKNGIVKNGVPTLLGDWGVHVASWADHPGVVTVRYEDLPGAFEDILKAYGMPIDERMQKAIEFSDIKVLRDFEDREKFIEAGKQERFFGGDNPQLDRTQCRRLWKSHRKVMERFGYKGKPHGAIESQTCSIGPRRDTWDNGLGQSVLVHDVRGPAPAGPEG